jgi:hypothetical protein
MATSRVSRVLYLYGFVPESAQLPPDSLRGVDDAAVELLDGPGFCSAVARLEAEAYQPEHVEAQFQEVAWVADRAVAHERVVAWFVDHAEIVPARLLTLYSSEQALAETARSERDRVLDLLQRFRGLREWDLKISYKPSELKRHLGELSTEVAELDRQIEQAAPGKRFLLTRKREDVLRTELTRAARTAAAAYLDDLRGHARDVIRLPATATEAELPIALNVALLVAGQDAESLRQRAATQREELEARGFVVALSGPWAPYRFMGKSDEE